MADQNPQGGCQPLGPATSPLQRMRALMNELRNLSPEDFRIEVVTLKAVLTTAISTAFDTYRVPMTHQFLITEIRGHLAFKAVTGETLAITGIGNPSIRDRIAMKAMNCQIAFKNQDRQGQLIFDNQSLALATLLEAAGGGELDFSKMDVPLIVPPGETLRMDATLLDSATASVIGGSTEYGLTVVGVLNRVKAS